ncbi:MAG: hypothetical protein ACLU9S_10845 [Oscillospiraceae bacterium]
MNGEEDHFNYTQIGAYNGGSSLAMHGALAGSQTVNLYKTKLDVTADSSISLTYNKPSADDTSKAQIALIFEEDPTQTVYLPIENSGKKTDGLDHRHRLPGRLCWQDHCRHRPGAVRHGAGGELLS